jgi:peroxiredoxin
MSGRKADRLAWDPHLQDRKEPMKPAILPMFFSILVAGVLARPMKASVFELGAAVTDFGVQDLEGATLSYSTFKGNVTVLAFISTRCPMSNAFNFRMNELYKEFEGRVRFVVINSNVDEPAEEVRRHAERMGYDFPVYKDADSVVADLFGAKATPDTFVVDQKGIVRYHGFIEDAANPERTKNHALRLAIEAVLQNKDVPTPETHSIGCAIRRTRPLNRLAGFPDAHGLNK